MAGATLLIRDVSIIVRGFDRGIHHDDCKTDEASDGESGKDDGFDHALFRAIPMRGLRV